MNTIQLRLTFVFIALSFNYTSINGQLVGNCQTDEIYDSNYQYCLHKSKYCDGFPDLLDKSDEQNCQNIPPDIQNQYVQFSTKCSLTPLKVINSIDRNECLRICAGLLYVYDGVLCGGVNHNSKSLRCEILPMMNFCQGYYSVNENFYLHKKGLTGKLKCDTGVLVNRNLQCNGIDNCGDASDETKCEKVNEGFKIRLFSEFNDRTSGRLEISSFGNWGQVCYSGFNRLAAEVACKQLGFDRAGILTTVEEAGLSSGNNRTMRNFLCSGDESSLRNCKSDSNVGQCSPSNYVALQCIPKKQECGTRIDDQWSGMNKIVGGFIARAGAFPWQARLFIESSYEHICGGTIINEEWIVTAGHCLVELQKRIQRDPKEVLSVIVGDLSDFTKGPEEKSYKIEKYIVHENYNSVTFENDVALIKIQKNPQGQKIIFGNEVRPSCLPSQGQEPLLTYRCMVSGWGRTGEVQLISNYLRAVVVPILEKSYCDSLPDVMKNMFCAGYKEGGKDACDGDSGGPLVCEVNGKFILYGITSWGEGCARKGFPGIYTTVWNYIDWMRTTMEKNP